MEALLLVILLVLVIILLMRQSETRERLTGKLNDVANHITSLEKQIKKLEQQPPANTIQQQPTTPNLPRPEPEERQVWRPKPVPTPTPIETEEKLQRKKEEVVRKRTYLEELHERQSRPVQPAPEPQESWWDKFIRNNPDIEKFIGENLANKIGIAVLVLGIAFFVKYAIDKDWIREGGRIAIGFVCGGVLIGIAHYLRNSYRSFSSVLVGGGISVFYFTVAFAFQEYKMMDQTVAFGAMVVITAFAVALSLLYNRLELAVLATIGGFITPFLVSTGNANYAALFTYLTILNVGLLVLAYFKRWPAINIIALFFTVIIYGSWLALYSSNANFPNKTAFTFATVFYILFIATNTLNNLREKRIFAAFDFSILLSINALYYTAGIIILKDVNGGDYKGLFTAALGVINLGMAYFLFRNQRIDKNFIYLLIGLTLTYISLAAPIQLSGNNITLFWAAECVVLYWLYTRSNISLLKIASLIISGLAFISLAMDIEHVYGHGLALPIIANKAFVTTLVTAVAYMLLYLQVKKSDEQNYIAGIPNKLITTGLLILFMSLFYASGAMEISYQFGNRLPGTGAKFIYLQLYTYCFALLILLILLRQFNVNGIAIRNAVLLLCFGLYLLYILPIGDASRTLLIDSQASLFAGHWLADIAYLLLAFAGIQYVRKNRLALSKVLPAFTWVLCIALLIFISVEVGYLFLWIGYNNTPDSIDRLTMMYSKAGVTITWAVTSFVLMWLGMRYRFKTLRIVSLSLFTLALLKLFLWDIRNIGEGGKIAAFIALGVLLLIISFMYQRLKKLFADDEAASK